MYQHVLGTGKRDENLTKTINKTQQSMTLLSTHARQVEHWFDKRSGTSEFEKYSIFIKQCLNKKKKKIPIITTLSGLAYR